MVTPNPLRSVALGALLVILPTLAHAQQRPLVTEDPETVGAGLVLVEVGLDVQRGIVYPASGLEGNLLRLGLVGVSFGLGSVVELQFDGGVFDRLTVTSRTAAPLTNQLDFTGNHTADVDDLVIGTKVRLLSERGHPALGLRFATRLPNAGNESGLGLDTEEFDASVLAGKTVQSIRMVGNVGYAVAGDPTRGDQQADLIVYGASLARAVRQGVEVVAEVNGRHPASYHGNKPPPGSENQGMMRLGVRGTIGMVRIDGGILIGMTSRDPNLGFTAGFTWVFHAFTPP